MKEDFKPADIQVRPGFWQSYRTLFDSPGMAGLYSLTFLRSLGNTITLPIASLFIVSLTGLETGAASITGIVIGSAAFASAVSAAWLGRLGDRIGHNRILILAAMLAALLYLPQAFVTTAWQLAVLQALSGLAVGGLMPATAALMNLWAPVGNQGATYGLDNSIQAAARAVAPMVGAAIALWLGMRGVFAGAALVYVVIAFVAWRVVVRAEARQITSLLPQASVGD